MRASAASVRSSSNSGVRGNMDTDDSMACSCAASRRNRDTVPAPSIAHAKCSTSKRKAKHSTSHRCSCPCVAVQSYTATANPRNSDTTPCFNKHGSTRVTHPWDRLSAQRVLPTPRGPPTLLRE